MIPVELDIIPLSEINMGDAYDLYRKVMDGPFSQDQFVKKYQTSPAGITHVAQLAYLDNKPVGFYGAVPCMVEKNGEQFLAAQGCDFFTLKEYRKQRIHYHLGNRCYELLQSHGCKFVFGFHSVSSYNASKKLDWQVANKNLFRFHLPVNAYYKSKLLYKLTAKEGYRRKFESVFKPYIDHDRQLKNLMRSENGISVVYNSEYLNYKTFTPNYIVQMHGVVFWVHLKSYFEIGAVYYEDAQDITTAIEALTLLLKKLPVYEIVLNAPYNTELYRTLAKFAEPQPSWIIGYRNFTNRVDGAELLCNPADLDTY